jgi:hypothetical protein
VYILKKSKISFQTILFLEHFISVFSLISVSPPLRFYGVHCGGSVDVTYGVTLCVYAGRTHTGVGVDKLVGDRPHGNSHAGV